LEPWPPRANTILPAVSIPAPIPPLWAQSKFVMSATSVGTWCCGRLCDYLGPPSRAARPLLGEHFGCRRMTKLRRKSLPALSGG
jgi:hypothetical protein